MNLINTSTSMLFLLLTSGLMIGMYDLILIFNNKTFIIEWEIISLNSSSFFLTFILDWMSLSISAAVMMISSMIMMYSKEYMISEKHFKRFILIIFMFVLSMQLLVYSPNLVSILLGWDGLGLTSYCLVIFYQNNKSFNAGMLTALSNRIGDVAIIMAITWMFNMGSWNFLFMYNQNNMLMTTINLFIMTAGLTKSAQIPFSAWLPAAMAAPTPVSALVHSSTLVTAGVYLMIRFNHLFSNNLLNQLLMITGSLTMIMSGLTANFEFDFKKIIALSTLSQLGLMMTTIAMGLPNLSFFHLLTHAMFKALMFMCAGTIIHSINNYQDTRNMGGLINCMPLTSSFFLISSMAMCGAPFMAGFYSKDLIMEMAYLSYLNTLMFMLISVAAGLTASYSLRLIFLTMTNEFKGPSLNQINKEEPIMMMSMLILVIFSMSSGSMISWTLFSTPPLPPIPMKMKMITTMMFFTGSTASYYLNFMKNMLNQFKINKSIYLLLFNSSMWFIPILSTHILNPKLMKLSGKIKLMDKSWNELFSIKVFTNFILFSSIYNQKMHFNKIKLFLLSFTFWLLLLYSMMMATI